MNQSFSLQQIGRSLPIRRYDIVFDGDDHEGAGTVVTAFPERAGIEQADTVDRTVIIEM